MSSDSLSFIDILSARAPAHDRAKAMMLYGRFVGAWDGTVTIFRASREQYSSTCEAHFGWVLGGRAIQDVWIAPSRQGREPGTEDRMYGTTLRVYDPRSDQWQIQWSDSVRQDFIQMVGGPVGSDILQEYRDAQGTICQWCFVDIAPDSFRWISRESTDNRQSWRVTSVFHFARRKRAGREHDTGSPADETRAFDFWQGFWTVTEPQSGKHLGHSKVDLILGGHVLHEQWSGADGYKGESFNVFDKDRQCWHQSWVSDNGTVLLLDGGMKAGVMDLRGIAPDGEHQRIRWSPQTEGAVLQEWDSSNDGGQSWRPRFSGLYRRA
jgi:hypothetical protein